ncbi:SDR family oxidoreductase [Mycolicibacterium litorale]|uniref:Oxidoreductase EphD n=1 Tax=Mycolicibacterium litorale TaxID=758802 RepID=A0AAD1MTR7_9MYCO|nr:SDR family oxidoreductase [Mycolicibacterium litorale]MCV7414441.1 SDR family oxidoreductase [Mycolicibacterium litorale]BBY15361.1 putative oxidoreductase EphD [Mycolicibacterium litorale]
MPPAISQATPRPAPRFVDSTDGVRVAVYEEGNTDGPTLILVHGWPDSHVVWDSVVAELADRFHLVRYDNRGVSPTSAPKRASAYTTARYADDFAAVADAVAPGRQVHVVAHDWGSTGMWEYLSRPEAAARVASFTSLSGPSVDHVFRYVLDGLKRPYRLRRLGRALNQFARLSYMIFLSIPLIAPISVRAFIAEGLRQFQRFGEGIPAERLLHSRTYPADAARSVKVYRANYFPSLLSARSARTVDVPVQLIVNTRDAFIRPYVYDEIDQWVPTLWRRELRAGHWSPMSHAPVIARAVAELVEHIDGRPATRELRRARVGVPRDHFTDMLVSVTGAGSGIGRETALAFAREGAELVVSDIDEASAKETANAIQARGGIAHAYALDVSDADAVERFADEVCATHGLPDIVVNNAGVGQAGRFLDTPRDQWDRVLDVNLGGVVNGCRAFARRLVERGTGGHIVNVASMASYAPLQSLNAYCTSKAAVYMFSDCLRAELDDAGIGLTTICPSTVNTNIVRDTRIHAPADRSGDVAGRRGQLQKMFAMRRYGPDKAAKAIVAAVKANKAIRPVMPEAYFVYGVSRVLPQALRSTARGRVL